MTGLGVVLVVAVLAFLLGVLVGALGVFLRVLQQQADQQPPSGLRDGQYIAPAMVYDPQHRKMVYRSVLVEGQHEDSGMEELEALVDEAEARIEEIRGEVDEDSGEIDGPPDRPVIGEA